MRHLREVLMIGLAFSTLGCVTATPEGKGTELLHSMLPANAPSFSGGYDFDLLGPVEGNGCASWSDSTTYWTTVPGTDIGKNGELLENQAEAAAIFDAVSKLKDADSILPLRLKSNGTGDKVCVTVYGRGIRYLHAGPTPVPVVRPQ